MYRKVLLIGLGGSGGKTLRFLKRDLSDWLASKGWTDGIPAGWQFLHIDSPTTPDGLQTGGMPLSNKEYVGLVSGGTTLRPLVDRLDGIHDSYSELTGWRVEPSTAPKVALEIGCGQYRALGRTVGLSFAQAIKQGLQGAIDRMFAVDVEPELDRLYTMVHGGGGGGDPAGPPIPIIISSLAGGTGAGLLLDVADILHSMRPTWADLSMGLYYTSDVFPSDAGIGVHPNGLGAVSEVLNGAWWGGSGAGVADQSVTAIPGKQSEILSQIAGLDRGVQRTGTHCNFLIGATNAGGAAIARDGQLFEMVGGALLSWVTDLIVQESFVAYTAANWENLAAGNLTLENDVISNIGAEGEAGLPAFSALGFARVSVGTKYLRRYAAQRLAKDAALYMAEGHVLTDVARQIKASENLADPDRIAERLVDMVYPTFRQNVDVADLNAGSAQVDFSIADNVRDALTPAAFRSWMTEQQRWIATQIRDDKDANGDTWAERLLPIVRHAQTELERRVGDELPSMFQEWARLASERFPIYAERAVAEHGLRVAIGLIESLAAELSSRVSGAIVDLEKQAQDYRTWGGRESVENATRKAMGDILTKHRVGPDTEYVTRAIEEAVKYARCSSLAIIADRAALLLERFGSDFLRPLAQALREGLSDLNNSVADRGEWPDWSAGLPPQHLEPPRSEYTVIEKEDFAATFEALLRETYSGKSDLAARAEARGEISGGTSIRAALAPLRPGSADHTALNALTLLTVEQPWLPGFELTGGAIAARRALFKARCTSNQVLERADQWLMRLEHPFEQLLSVDLRSYTRSPEGGDRDGSPEYVDRQNRVVSKLEAAVAAAAPLVRLNGGLLSQLHPKMVENGLFRTHLSGIPFRGHPLESRMRESRIAALFRGGDSEQNDPFDKLLTTDADLPHIDIISQLWGPVLPETIDSLMSPIGEEWVRAQKPAAHVQFWRLRRTRPLREFVPVPQRHLRCMIRGWFTGRMLGLIDTSSMPYSIVQDLLSVNARYVRFPSRFLSGKPTSLRDELAYTLEALPLAMVEVNRSTTLSPLEPFVALRSLGMSDPESNDVLAYARPHPAISGWIESGTVPGADRVPGTGSVHPALQQATDPNSRREALSGLLATVMDEYRDSYAAYLNDVQRDRKELSEGPLWPGIHDEIQVALEGLQQALSAQSQKNSGL